MRVVLLSSPVLLIGLVAIGCGKEGGGQSPGKLDPSLPTVTLNIPSMH